MSAYKEFSNIQFANGELLVKALAELGLRPRIGQGLALHGYQGDVRQQRAQIVVDRQQIGTSSNDLGFAWNGQAFVPIISEYDARRVLNEEWRQKLQATYAKLAILQFLGSKGAAIGTISQLDDGSLAFTATVEVQR